MLLQRKPRCAAVNYMYYRYRVCRQLFVSFDIDTGDVTYFFSRFRDIAGFVRREPILQYTTLIPVNI